MEFHVMTTKKIIILILSLLAFGAVIFALCFFFLGNKVIIVKPEFIQVKKIDDNFFLTTQFSQGNQYMFKIEQKIDGEFMVVDVVKSDVNSINLSKQNLDLSVGNEFQFSACFATENDNGNGDFCTPISWNPHHKLDGVNYDEVKIVEQGNKIIWNAVEDASMYSLFFFDESGEQASSSESESLPFYVFKPEFSMFDSLGRSKLGAGEFKLFIVADNSDINILPSDAGEGFERTILMDIKNEILNVSHKNERFLVTCTQKVKTFQIFVDDLMFEFDAGTVTKEGNNFVFDISNFLSLFKVNFEKNHVKILTKQNGHVLESECFVVN